MNFTLISIFVKKFGFARNSISRHQSLSSSEILLENKFDRRMSVSKNDFLRSNATKAYFKYLLQDILRLLVVVTWQRSNLDVKDTVSSCVTLFPYRSFHSLLFQEKKCSEQWYPDSEKFAFTVSLAQPKDGNKKNWGLLLLWCKKKGSEIIKV